jgi:hypothetical protein
MVGERCRVKDWWPGSRRLGASGVTRRWRGCVDGCVEQRHAWGARGRERPGARALAGAQSSPCPAALASGVVSVAVARAS